MPPTIGRQPIVPLETTSNTIPAKRHKPPIPLRIVRVSLESVIDSSTRAVVEGCPHPVTDCMTPHPLSIPHSVNGAKNFLSIFFIFPPG